MLAHQAPDHGPLFRRPPVTLVDIKVSTKRVDGEPLLRKLLRPFWGLLGPLWGASGAHSGCLGLEGSPSQGDPIHLMILVLHMGHSLSNPR